MPETENQQVKTNRDKLLERVSARFPDRKFTADNAENGEGEAKVDDLEQAIMDIFEEQDATISESRDKNQALLKILDDDPRCMEFIGMWAETGDPRAALVATFGDDLSSLGTEEGRGQFSEQLKGWRDKKAKNDEMNAEAEANWDETLNSIASWGESKGLDTDTQAKVLARLMDITAGGLMNKYTVDDFDMILKNMNYDQDVKAARTEGEIAGRNEKIKAERKARSNQGVPPALPGGQGMRIQQQKPKEKDIWDEID